MGDTAAAGNAPPFFLTNKLAPSAVFAVNNSTVNVDAEAESLTFAGGATWRVSGGGRGGGGTGAGTMVVAARGTGLAVPRRGSTRTAPTAAITNSAKTPTAG